MYLCPTNARYILYLMVFLNSYTCFLVMFMEKSQNFEHPFGITDLVSETLGRSIIFNHKRMAKIQIPPLSWVRDPSARMLSNKSSKAVFQCDHNLTVCQNDQVRNILNGTVWPDL